MNQKSEATLLRIVDALKTELGGNIHSCYLYGSAVRGNAIEGVSDLNLLIVLDESNSAAHQAVARVVKSFPKVSPFVLKKQGFARSARAFAPKFASIRRHSRLLHGADVLADLKSDVPMERFLCEQALRNLRLRLVHSFITRAQHKSYDRFLTQQVTSFFVHFSEVLRLEGITLPVDYTARLPVLAREFKIDVLVLQDLLALKGASCRFSEAEAIRWHDRVFPLVDTVLQWIEERWTA